MKVVYKLQAWYAIGFDDGKFRIAGGRAIYEAVMYESSRAGKLVKLARLEFADGAHEVKRYVKPETWLEFLAEKDGDETTLKEYYEYNPMKDKFVFTGEK